MTTAVKFVKADDHPLSVVLQEQNLRDGQWVSVGPPQLLTQMGDSYTHVVYQNKRYIVSEISLDKA